QRIARPDVETNRSQRTERDLFVEVLDRECLAWTQRLRGCPPHRFVELRGGACCSPRDHAHDFLWGMGALHPPLGGRPRGADEWFDLSSQETLRACEESRDQVSRALGVLDPAGWRELIQIPVGIDPGTGDRRRRGELAWLVLKSLILHGRRFDDHLRPTS